MSADLPEKGAEIHLAARPRGVPRPGDFRRVEVRVGKLGENEILVRNSWMSVDPSTRIRMDENGSEYLPRFELGRPLDGWAVGTVIDSRAAQFPVGEQVLHPRGWRELSVLAADGGPRGPTPIEVDAATPAQRYLGALGWVGLTAYAGLRDVAGLRPGDVVFVSGAAGAVGSLVVQIAKLRGHKVIASAGSAAKVEFLRDELGADAAFSYRDGDISRQLAALAPEGIDVYFDNVGGAHLEAALGAMRPGGRIALCGAISNYNEPGGAGPANLFEAIAKGLTLRGFLARMYAHRLGEFRREMRAWLAAGQVVERETVVEGLERAPEALIAMLRGENVGKMLVRLR